MYILSPHVLSDNILSWELGQCWWLLCACIRQTWDDAGYCYLDKRSSLPDTYNIDWHWIITVIWDITLEDRVGNLEHTAYTLRRLPAIAKISRVPFRGQG